MEREFWCLESINRTEFCVSMWYSEEYSVSLTATDARVICIITKKGYGMALKKLAF